MDVKEWAERVEVFLEENQELADDPTLGQSASQRLLVDTTNLLIPLANDLTVLMNQQEEAANKLTDAINDPHCSAGKVHKREKEYERLKAESEELKHWQDKLDDFRARVHDIYMGNTTMIEIQSVDEIPQFKSEAEEAEFWSTHSLGEQFLDEMEPLPEDVLPAPRKESFLKRLFR